VHQKRQAPDKHHVGTMTDLDQSTLVMLGSCNDKWCKCVLASLLIVCLVVVMMKCVQCRNVLDLYLDKCLF
jgi:hypothetical protein